MYLHTLPSLTERTKDAQKKLLHFLNQNVRENDEIASFFLEADICTSVLFNAYLYYDFSKFYKFEILETQQNNVGLFTRVICSLKPQETTPNTSPTQ